MTYEELKDKPSSGHQTNGFQVWACDGGCGWELDVMENGYEVLGNILVADAIRLRDALLELFPLKVDTPTDSK